MNLVIFFLICFLGFDPESPGPQGQSLPPSIELSESRPLHVAYIEYIGPYWSLGPIIDRVAHDARSLGVSDELLIRYIEGQAGPTPNSVHAQVGFEIARTESPPSPYQIADWPTALAARKTVRGPDGLSLRHLTSIRTWARSQNLDQAGDMMAIVKLGTDGESTSIEQADILLPVCVPDEPPPKPQVLKTPESEKSTESEDLEASRPAPRITRIIQLPLPDQIRREDGQKEEDDTHAPSPTLTEETVARLAANRDSGIDVVALPPSQELGSSVPTAAATKPRRADVSVREWIDAGRFTELAAALLPEKSHIAVRSWSDQIAARILAIDGALHKASPDQEGWLAGFAAELATRRDLFKAACAKSARVIGLQVPTRDAREADRKSVMFEFDRLMTQVSYQALTPAQIREKVADLLDEAIPLVSP